MSTRTSTQRPVNPESLRIRRACPADHAVILALVQELELAYPAMDLSCFWVAEWDGTLVAAAELKDLGSCSLLSCVGVREELQGRGIGQALVDRISKEARSPVYLYTLVPGFFRKAGFSDARSLPPGLPPRAIYGCKDCDPSLCLCLVRTHHGS
jgi:N-acetylglutamate synthase-like GNAT family acetyltransferase